jgi:iron complex outermembrane receptor protein
MITHAPAVYRARMKAVLVAGTSAIAALIAMPAHAERAPAGGPPPPGASTDASDQGSVPGDIIVTAQRREERARDVPISITSMTGEQIERAGITSTRDIQVLVPALNIDSTGYNVQPTLRGVTTTIGGAAEPSVAIYIDGVYQPDQSSLATQLPDVAQIEVLKGPQGTLFGRNATGGAILIKTRKPEFTTSGTASVSYGTLNSVAANGFITGPLVPDLLAFSLSAAEEHNDGYYHDLLQNGKRIGALSSVIGNAKLLLTPAAGLSMTLTAYLSRRDNGAGQLYTVLNNNVFIPAGNTAVYGQHPFDVAQNSPSNSLNTVQQYSLMIKYDGAIGTFTSISSMFRARSTQLQDLDYTSLTRLYYDQRIKHGAYSQELNFASRQFGAFSLTAGLFGYKAHHQFDPITIVGTPRYSSDKDLALAAYGELTVRPLAGLTMIGGLRYSWERITARAAVNNPNPPLLGEKSWHAFTPRFSAVYAVSPEVNVFATFSQGFKSGVFNSIALSPTPVNPEYITSYEIGTKGVTADRRLSWSASAFAYTWKDVQLTTLVGLLSTIQNAARVKAKGVEFDATLRIAEGLDLRAGAAYLDARYDSFPNANVLVPRPGVNTGNVAVSVDLTGQRPLKAPELTFSSTLNYSHDFQPGRLTLSGTLYHSSGIGLDVSGRIRRPAYTTLSALAAFRPAGSKFEFSIYGRNLTDVRYIASTIIGNQGDAATYAMPRVVGVKVGYAF